MKGQVPAVMDCYKPGQPLLAGKMHIKGLFSAQQAGGIATAVGIEAWRYANYDTLLYLALVSVLCSFLGFQFGVHLIFRCLRYINSQRIDI